MAGFENTRLWVKSLGQRDENAGVDDPHAKLLATYSTFRDRAGHLTSKIAAALPNLTIHDVTHLDALWETADVITGPDYPLNPMEGFVLGGAFLLHDAALCFEAFEGGQLGLRSAVEWTDSFAAEREKKPKATEDAILASADFAALRLLHARRAADLGTVGWRDSDGTELFLIDNSELRKRYGSLIGLIASSHHWSIDEVGRRLPSQINAPGSYPREWRVDPIKLACILRCADAAHIDDRRAPDFLYALTRRQGLSADHWKAQNWLARIDTDLADQSGRTLLFTSNHDFSEDDSNAWWVAYDAIFLVEQEIRASNSLLLSRDLPECSPPFRTQRIAGADSPSALSEYVRVNGWRPCSARIHVSNIEGLVGTLGGVSLYGAEHQLEIAMRELIQNARDAIVARRELDSEFKGAITVSLLKDADGTIIEIGDDGVGMSERVLTGPLLDFGTSFWTSSLVQEEFPGLRSTNFRSVGRFGIGFYATFMVAAAVSVASRKWDQGLDDVLVMKFSNGLTLRPTLSRHRPSGFGSSTSSIVSLRLKPGFSQASMMDIKSYRMGEQDILVKFRDLVTLLVVGLDVDVFVRTEDDGLSHIHSPVDLLESVASRRDWLAKLCLAGYRQHIPDDFVASEAGRLRFLRDGDRVLGLAAVSTAHASVMRLRGLHTVGGFAVSVHGFGTEGFIGYLEYEAASAKRERELMPVAPAGILRAWADEQIEILRSRPATTAHDWALVAGYFADLGIDPYSIAHAGVITGTELEIVNLDELMNIVETSGLAIIKMAHIDHVDMYNEISDVGGVPVLKPLNNSSFLNLAFDSGVPSKMNSLTGCIYRNGKARGCNISFELRSSIGKGAFSMVDAIIVRVLN